ncbi:MAG: hypothetical protein ACR2NN_12145 [Bryobacteraceae bacterium]
MIPKLLLALLAGHTYGEMRPILVDGKRGAEIYVRPAPLESAGPLLRARLCI